MNAEGPEYISADITGGWAAVEGVIRTVFALDENGSRIPADSPRAQNIEVTGGAEKDVTILEDTVTLRHIANHSRLAESAIYGRDMDKERTYLRAIFKQEFHLLKVLHLLFPKTIPDIIKIISNDFFSVRERVHGETLDVLYTWAQDIRGWDKFRREKIGLLLTMIGLGIDNNAANYIKRPDGTLAYVDTVVQKGTRPHIVAGLMAAIQAKRLAGALSHDEYTKAIGHVRMFVLYGKVARRAVM